MIELLHCESPSRWRRLQILNRRAEKCHAVPERAQSSIVNSAKKPSHLSRQVVVIYNQWPFLRAYSRAYSAMPVLKLEKLIILLQGHAVTLLQRSPSVGLLALGRLFVFSLSPLVAGISATLGRKFITFRSKFRSAFLGADFILMLAVVFSALISATKIPVNLRPRKRRFARSGYRPQVVANAVTFLTFVAQSIVCSFIYTKFSARLNLRTFRAVLFGCIGYNGIGHVVHSPKSLVNYWLGSFGASTSFEPLSL